MPQFTESFDLNSMLMQRTSLEFIPELNLLKEEEAQTQSESRIQNRKIVQSIAIKHERNFHENHHERYRFKLFKRSGSWRSRAVALIP